MGDENKELEETVGQILEKYRHDKGMLVSVLQDIQAKYRYLPKEALKQVCQGLLVPLSQVYSVATFFKAFSLLPRGRHLINVCLGTACHVRGTDKVLEKIERELGINAGSTTKDLKFTLETVNCVGACALGPIVKVDEEYHGEMSTDKVVSVLKSYT
ncbi:MAG: NAD(P)H-dependent oxidoreductase subunit E [Chloroflexi bacterium]|nr:NAD(P)H-dependent oxidoreductase subunit E [Chloroflexota bacterium]MBI2979901.1 NAD(P)H-dependent oxidoreductase subunit E [Chloroflexota bacterium]